MPAAAVSQSSLGSRVLSAVFVAVALGLIGIYAMTVISGTVSPKQLDFPSYYAAARLVLEGHGGSLYNFGALGAMERGIIAPYHLPHGVLPYVYPPYFAIAIAPLGLTSLYPAYIIWWALNLALLLGASLLIQRREGLPFNGSVAVWLGTWTAIPTFIALLQGQVSIVLLAFIGGAVLCLERRWDIAAGVLLAGATLKPTYILPCLVVLLVRARWRAVLSFALTLAVFIAASAALFGPSIAGAYLSTLIRATGWTTQFGYAPDQTASFAGPLRLVLPGPAGLIVLAILALASLAAVAYAARRAISITPVFSLALLVGLLLSPHVLTHDLVLLLVPVAAALDLREDGPSRLIPMLASLYALASVGFLLARVIHVQMVLLPMCALGIWLFLAIRVPQVRLRAR